MPAKKTSSKKASVGKKVLAKATSFKNGSSASDAFESFHYIQQSDVKVAAKLAPTRSKRKLKFYSSDEESDEQEFEQPSPEAPLNVENEENTSPNVEQEVVLDPESIYSLCADDFGRCVSCGKTIDDEASNMSAHDDNCKLSNSLLRAFENHGIYSEADEVSDGVFEL